MKKTVKFFTFLIGIVFCSLASHSLAFAESQALSAKMIKLKLVKAGDLILCSTGNFEKVAKEVAKEYGVTDRLFIIESLVLVEKNSEEALIGNLYEGGLSVTHINIKHDVFNVCKEIAVVEGKRLDDISKIFSKMLDMGGLPIIVGDQPTSPEPPQSTPAPTVPASRRTYL